MVEKYGQNYINFRQKKSTLASHKKTLARKKPALPAF